MKGASLIRSEFSRVCRQNGSKCFGTLQPATYIPLKLNYKEYPHARTTALELGRPLVIIHGLLGHLNNWRNVSNQPDLAKDRRIFAVDLRNHGASPRSEKWDLESLAGDTSLFLEDRQLPPAVLLGHSLGGKVAMATCLVYPGQVRALICVDIAPVEYDQGLKDMDEIGAILSAVDGVDLTNGATRNAVDKQLLLHVPSLAVRQFIITNLQPTDPTSDNHGAILSWKPNVKVLLKNYDKIRGFELPLEAANTFEGPALFIRGARSNFITESNAAAIREYFPKAVIRTIEGAGHWVHHEKQAEFVALVAEFLKAVG